jgi:hypothetical protein
VRERRRSPRHRGRLRGVVRRGAKREDAVLLDVSLSGLSLQTSLELSQGDEVALEIPADGARVRVQALAWNARRVRRGGETSNVVGMMLAEVGADYEALVERVAGSRPSAAPVPAKAPAEPLSKPTREPAPETRHRAPPPHLGPRRLLWWRLRVKETFGQRTRIVTLAAASAEAAAAQSLAEMGAGWEVIEVKPAAAGR